MDRPKQAPPVVEPEDRLGPAKAEAEKKEKKKKQAYFEGMEPVRHPAIDKAFDLFHDADEEFKVLSERTKDLKEKLQQKMLGHKVEHYETESGWVLRCENKTKFSAKRTKVVDETKGINPDGLDEKDDISED